MNDDNLKTWPRRLWAFKEPQERDGNEFYTRWWVEPDVRYLHKVACAREVEYIRSDLVNASPWISVKDRLPPPDRRVLALYGPGDLDVSWWIASAECWSNHRGRIGVVTHWMPIPPIPKE